MCKWSGIVDRAVRSLLVIRTKIAPKVCLSVVVNLAFLHYSIRISPKSRCHEISPACPFGNQILIRTFSLSPSTRFATQTLPTQLCPQIPLSTNPDPSAIVAATSLILALLKMNTPETSAFNSLFAHPLISIATSESNPSA